MLNLIVNFTTLKYIISYKTFNQYKVQDKITKKSAQ